MIHHRQRLSLRLEARDDLARVHAELDDLQRDTPPHRLLLFRHPHDAESALTDLLTQFVRANMLAPFLRLEPRQLTRNPSPGDLNRLPVRSEQRTHFRKQRQVIATSLGHECSRFSGGCERAEFKVASTRTFSGCGGTGGFGGPDGR